MKKAKWTEFMDMHSGGGLKEKGYHYIYIEASEEEAKIIFYNRFGHNPERISCTCCGDDYSITESNSLKRITAYERHCEFINNKKEKGGGHYIEKQSKKLMKIRIDCKTPKEDKWGLNQTLKEFKKRKDVLIIYAKDIKAEERKGKVPEQGYI